MDDCIQQTPETAAREIVSALAGSFRRGHGCALSFIDCLRACGQSGSAPTEELRLGMVFAIQQGWVQILEDVLLYRLTPAGFFNFNARDMAKGGLRVS